MKYTRHTLVMAVAMLMTACATNKGDVALSTIAPSIVNTPKEPTYQDVETPSRSDEQLTELQQPTMGIKVKLLERNMHSDQEYSKQFSTTDIKPFNGKFDDLKKELIESKRAKGELEDSNNYQNFYPSRKRNYMQYVQSGWVAYRETKNHIDFDNKIIKRGMEGYIFYIGKMSAKFLPNTTATYKGSWDFATDAKKDRKPLVKPDGFYTPKNGVDYGAFSYHESVKGDAKLRRENKLDPVSHTSEFTVDFAKKKLTGKLSYNQYNENDDNKTGERYTIDAKLDGNRFRGKATAKKSDDPYFGKNSKSLEGGFFGEHAQELGGSFLADDNSLFAVFGARRLNSDKTFIDENKAKDGTEQLFDATQLDLESFKTSKMVTFGKANQIVIDGKALPLWNDPKKSEAATKTHTVNGKTIITNTCCDNLKYVQFGSYHTQTGDANKKENAHLFVVGERTTGAKMNEQKGEVQYAGHWQAQVKTSDGTPGSADAKDSKAEFKVDFDNKKLTGSLFQKDTNNATISITDGKIDGNGFTATFKTNTKGFILDGHTNKTATLKGNVTGAFYGMNAEELGGYLNSNDSDADKIIGVFGGKKQVKKK